jgi:AcrR family transcriptional regulator
MKAQKTKKKEVTKDLIIDEVFELIESRGWVHMTFHDIVDHMGTSLVVLHGYFPNKYELLKAMVARIDQETLKRVSSDIESLSPSDRLFDVIMARFEASKPYKAALRRMWHEGFRYPYLMVVYFPLGFNSMIWILEAAGMHCSGLMGILQVKAFGLLYLKLLNTWFEDMSEDLSKTMAEVDKNVKRFRDYFLKLFC